MDQFAEVIIKIKEAVDLVDLIQEYIPLTRRGRTAVALCPFHAEKTPSFTVYPDSQHFRCYGCGKTGDIFDFLLEKEGWAFREAAEILAEKLGISMAGVFARERKQPASRVDVHGTLGKVRDWFAELLLCQAGVEVRDYLESRGLLGMAEKFGLGAHPRQQGALRKFASKNDLPMQVLVQAGLLTQAGQREPFAGRAMFPIIDERGRVAGFGGRVLPETSGRGEGGPKYLNSPESPFFNKRRLLFGLRQAKDEGARRIIVVEGYTDVIACHQVGMHGVVATLGTALTADHARMLERYASEGVVLLFDGDRAGRQAADRAFCELVHTSLPVRLALLPEGTDPADLVSHQHGDAETGVEAEAGRNRLEALVDQADDALRMWFKLLGQRYDLNLDVDVQRAAAECGRILGQVESLARREALQRAMARHLGLSEAALGASIPRRRKSAARHDDAGSEKQQKATLADPLEEADCDLLACLLADIGLLDRCLQAPCGAGHLRKILDLVAEAPPEHRASSSVLSQYLFARLGEKVEPRRFLAESLDRARRIRDAESIFLVAQQGRRSYFAKEKASRILRDVQKAMAEGDQKLTDELTRQYMHELRQTQG